MRYCLATRLTSAAVTFSVRSRWRKNSFQSPAAAHSLSSIASRWLLENNCSRVRLNSALTRFTSSSPIGGSSRLSSVCTSAARASSILSGSVWAKKISAPGSWVVKFIPLTLLAFFVSTSAL